MKELGFVITMLFSSFAIAENAKDIEVTNAVIAMPDVSDVTTPTTIYFDIVNHSKQEDRLTSITTKVCAHTIITEVKKINGAFEVLEIDTIGIPASSKLSMKPHSFYAICNKPEANMKIGDYLEITVNFDKTGPVVAKAKVEPANEQKH